VQPVQLELLSGTSPFVADRYVRDHEQQYFARWHSSVVLTASPLLGDASGGSLEGIDAGPAGPRRGPAGASVQLREPLSACPCSCCSGSRLRASPPSLRSGGWCRGDGHRDEQSCRRDGLGYRLPELGSGFLLDRGLGLPGNAWSGPAPGRSARSCSQRATTRRCSGRLSCSRAISYCT
jgi:hypothetical protein